MALNNFINNKNLKKMTNNIQNTQIELIEKKINMTSLILGVIFIALGIVLFIFSRNIEANMLSSTMVFFGVVSLLFALFFFISKLNAKIYSKTNSPIIERQLYYDIADFYKLKDIIENNDFESIDKFKRIEEGNIQLYVLYSKDKKFAALQLLKYEPFDFIPQTEIKIFER